MAETAKKRRDGFKKQMLTQALTAFNEVARKEAAVLKRDIPLPQGVADAEFRLADGTRLLVEFKKNLTPATLGMAVARIERFGRPGILVAPYITPPMAERLKALDVGFLDAAGNAYINTPETFVFITGRKPQTPVERDRPVRALRPAGLKAIFALLCDPDLVKAPCREVADAAGIALGAVGWVFNDLQRLGHIRVMKGRRRCFEDRDGLIDKWAEAYARELRPRLRRKRYRAADADWWKKEDLREYEMWLGGEPAGAILTKHLRPELLTVYGDTRFAKLARKIRATKDDHGDLEVVEKFWQFEPPPLDVQQPVAPPLLVYADLVATADARNIETARIIRERFLATDAAHR